jgi:hypothetical protein
VLAAGDLLGDSARGGGFLQRSLGGAERLVGVLGGGE